MSKITFAIVGSGYRAKFYVRIAKHYSEKYDIVGMLCRTEEKAEAIRRECGIMTTLREQDIIDRKPDFIVVAVNKASITDVSAYWRSKGFTVLCETPAGLNRQQLTDIWQAPDFYGKLVVAEQYPYYPVYQKIIETVQSEQIGNPVSASVSLAHDYHGIELIRMFLREKPETPFRMQVHRYELPVTKTGDRYHVYTEGEIIQKVKTIAHIEFADGKVATYDFDSEQYHSMIRQNAVKISGTRGEIIDNRVWFLDEGNKGREAVLFPDLQVVKKEAACGELSQDEMAIETLMEKVGEISRTGDGMTKWQQENLRNALQDAYFAILLQEADEEWIASESMPWQN